MVVTITGNTLIIQEKRKGKVSANVETYASPRSLMNRVEELHLRGQISHQRYQHLTEIVTRKTELIMRKS